MNKEMQAQSTYCDYPLLFTFSDVLSGEDFTALVQVRGRALLTVEWEDGEQSFEIASVQPSGFSEAGYSFEKFRRGIECVSGLLLGYPV